MNEPVFVDASAWVAVTNRKDRNRGEAVKIFQRLLRTSTALVTTNWTAYEALTIVNRDSASAPKRRKIGFLVERKSRGLWEDLAVAYSHVFAIAKTWEFLESGR
jgi:predicted nucleic acid-binding protein